MRTRCARFLHRTRRSAGTAQTSGSRLKNTFAQNCEYPGEWNGELERVEHAGETTVLVGRIFDTDGASLHVVSFLREQGGRIVSLDEYYGDDGPAPAWRQEMKLGTKINGALP